MSAPAEGALAASVHARCERKYGVEIAARGHRLAADEPAGRGGADAAPTPLELLASALAACTAITLRMYAEGKGWELGTVKVDCRALVDGKGFRFERVIRFGAPLAEEQRARLGEIAERTPVTKVVKAGAPLATELLAGDGGPDAA
jgi:putative redox protein